MVFYVIIISKLIVRKFIDQRENYYKLLGTEVPDFDGINTPRCIYGIVDKEIGIVRAGGAGQINRPLEPPFTNRTIIQRLGEHWQCAKHIQEYWLREQKDKVERTGFTKEIVIDHMSEKPIRKYKIK